MLKRDQDYMGVCNPDQKKYKPEIFERDICRQCARPECIRSSYKQSATDKRLEHAEQLTTFIDPQAAEVEESPLSHYPDELDESGKFIHRADLPETVHEPHDVDEAAQALAQLVQPSLPADSLPITSADTEVMVQSTEPTPEPPRPSDPWAVPEGARVNIYKEYEDSKDDPWSVDYEGPRRIKAESGVTITLSGKRKP